MIKPQTGHLWLIFLIFLGTFIAACTTEHNESDSSEQPEGLLSVAYVLPSDRLHIPDIAAEKLTHILFAFANVKEHRVVLERENDALHLSQLIALKEKNPDLKVILSVGGWSWSGNFSDAALNEENRRLFVVSALEILQKHDLDGLDIDWEYPGQIGDNNVFRPEDKENYTLLLRDCREGLDKLSDNKGKSGEDRYELSVATGANEAFLQHTEMDKAQEYLDYIFLMTYDFYGPWTPTTGHHAALYASKVNPTATSAAKGVDLYEEAGVPLEKIVLGVPFYGRGWTGVEPNENGRFQAYKDNATSQGYQSLLDEFIDKNGFVRYWDENAKVPYLWNEETRTFYTYEDPESLSEKAAFVKEKGLAGMMYWQHAHDPQNRLLGALHQALHGK